MCIFIIYYIFIGRNKIHIIFNFIEKKKIFFGIYQRLSSNIK